ncbi:MAG: hypothetical protein Q8S73_23880 [Deltaproteobacteria bacterium]|nr:hypothetical protein [Myxococcales bacterium]MDP3217172.1 hypothetical protein [Deltaproteobacteria bacterium]
MRSSSSLVLLLATLGSGLAACSDPAVNTGPVDAGNTVDTGSPVDTGNPADTGTPTDRGNGSDTGTNMDSGQATDSGPANDTGPVGDTGPRADTGPADAGPPYDPCAMASVVDLNAMGTTAGSVTRITRNNNNVGAMAPLVGPCGRPGHEVVFRYVPRTSARLRISTDNMGTDMMLDTVVWAQPMCAPAVGDAGVSALGCSDDNGTAPRTRASAFTTAAPAAMGTPIFIVVAGYTPPAGTGFVPQGNFELSVTEISTVAAGGMCDTTGQTNVCATGSICVGAAGAMMGTCTADGALNGACRAMGMACDGALVCSGSATSTSSRCRTAVAAGAACDPLRVMNVCATGSNCVTRNGASTCIATGTAGGSCRATEPRCDGMLSCSSAGVCRTIVAVDGACETANTTTVCAAGGTCVATTAGAAMGTCRAAGSAPGTACRATEPRCDGMLSCSASSVCRTVVAVGGACESSNSSTVCATGGTCVAATPGAAMGTCRAAGTAAGTACRDAAPRCDTGLDCSTMTGSGVCRRTIASGAACVPASTTELCAMGTACRPTSAIAGTCTMGTPETEPNNTPMMAQAAMTVSAVYSGMASSTDTDCFRVTVPMGGGIYAESNLPATPTCPSGGPDPVITVYNPAGTEIDSVDDGRGLCGTLTPAGSADVRNLPAGTYTVCIEGFNTMVANYLLTVGVIPPT